MSPKLILSFLIIFYLNNFSVSELTKDDCNCKLPSNRRIVNGKELKHIVPWSVSLADEKEGNIHFCGATIVNSKWVITSASCVFKYQTPELFASLNIRLINDLNDTEIESKTYKANKVLVHTNYRDKDPFHVGDVGLIELKTPIKFNKVIKPSCIGKIHEDYDDEIGSLQAIGFGSTSRYLDSERPKIKLSNKLREARFNYSKKPCFGHLICTTPVQSTSSICHGDLGSALHHQKNGIARVVGVGSYYSHEVIDGNKIYCAGKMAFSRISRYFNLIKNVVGEVCDH